MLPNLSDQALLMLALVTWHFDATSDIRQLLSQLRHIPDQVLSDAPRILSSEHHHLLVRSLECSDEFHAMCGVLSERYNELVDIQVTRGVFANELQRLLRDSNWLFLYCVEMYYLMD
jgi:hypothetical protein